MRDRVLRPTGELVQRLLVLDLLGAWVGASVPTGALQAFVAKNRLESVMSPGEHAIYARDRDAARTAYGDVISWRLERMWPLAWILGFDPEPTLDGVLARDIVQKIRGAFLPALGTSVGEIVERARVRSLEEVVRLEDRFACCHDAVYRAQLGEPTVPPAFHPVVHGGVIEERCRALGWALSCWEDGVAN